MDDSDFWLIIGILGLMSVSNWLRGKVIDMQFRMISQLQDDVAFLKDVARNTDALRSEHD